MEIDIQDFKFMKFRSFSSKFRFLTQYRKKLLCFQKTYNQSIIAT